MLYAKYIRHLFKRWSIDMTVLYTTNYIKSHRPEADVTFRADFTNTCVGT